jgi:hypothetical protein
VTRPGRTARVPLLAPAVLLHVASWLAVVAHGFDWVGSWMNAVDEVAGSVVIVGPLVAGLTANAYARLNQTALPELVVTSLHPVRGWYDTALRYWALSVVNLLVLLGEAVVLVRIAGPRVFAEALLIVPVCVLLLACHVVVGMVIGLRLGPRLAGAVAGVTSFGLFLLAVAQLAPRAFVVGGATDALVGQRYRASVQIALALVAFLTLAAVAVLSGWSSRWLRTRTVLGLTAVAGAMLFSSVGADLNDRLVAVQVPLRCRGEAPEVCVPADAPRSLGSASRGMHRLARPLEDAGVDLPDRWVDYWGQQPDPRVGLLSLLSRGELRKEVAPSDLIRSLTMPSTCVAYFDGRDHQQFSEVLLLLGHWIGFRNGLGRGSSQVPVAWFGSKESEAWVRATYAKLRRCDLADLTFPTSSR